MTETDWRKVKEIFALALEQSNDSRRAFLLETCAANEFLFAEVESLLAAHDEPEILVEKNAFDLSANLNPNGARLAGKQFGHYRIEREIGRGGMGAVFLAERSDGEFDKRLIDEVLKGLEKTRVK